MPLFIIDHYCNQGRLSANNINGIETRPVLSSIKPTEGFNLPSPDSKRVGKKTSRVGVNIDLRIHSSPSIYRAALKRITHFIKYKTFQ